MAGQGIRLVSVLPITKTQIKTEIVSDDDEDVIKCSICSKGFVSEMALRNHAMMEHFDAFLTGDPENWTEAFQKKPEYPQSNRKIYINDEDVKIKTEKVLSSMKPDTLTSLASEDVSYIIIKSEDSEILHQPLRKKRVKLVKVEKQEREAKKKDVVPFNGPFECVVEGACRRIFFSCCEYSAHYRDEHTRRRKVGKQGLRCQVCEKPLSASDESQFPYTCDVCGAGFNAGKELSDHTSEAHVKLKPFQCEICHKRFTQQGGVQQHMRMHTGDRPFVCTFCNKAFTQKSGLDQHLRIHTKVKPYRCVVCGKSFCQSIHLKQHMRTHTNVTPFQCTVCHKRFKQTSHLNYHMRNHAEELNEIQMEGTEVPAEEMEVPVVESEEQVQYVQMEQDSSEQDASEQSVQVVACDEIGGVENWGVTVEIS